MNTITNKSFFFNMYLDHENLRMLLNLINMNHNINNPLPSINVMTPMQPVKYSIFSVNYLNYGLCIDGHNYENIDTCNSIFNILGILSSEYRKDISNSNSIFMVSCEVNNEHLYNIIKDICNNKIQHELFLTSKMPGVIVYIKPIRFELSDQYLINKIKEI